MSKEAKGISPSPEQEVLAGKVQSYFDSNPYPGKRKPFKLEGLEPYPYMNAILHDASALAVVLAKVKPYSLKKDGMWAAGLHEAGQELGNVYLPFWYLREEL
ncbi:hypothetical protein A2870_02105 [Candidatus Curtissbacteria bacterium RIFCSPHIGHO2_01_FULL_41_11]|uniref:Uncharacterized protein n=1 Tax=Candidatus Curtissbacteria bacterium RIFCSPHIGHO2_01_FULL_41_11 TaxID=1797711 RepID=A0A1F5G3W1_9BACT|nr:MAG: hypothetical protein A2870_02105 [Candidatus Curtissbacteria bacterium RIFCSPHIGHO2_01_FULL_41_11]